MKIPLPTSRRKARIEIIPLIDVIFFLLATFMMISLSMIEVPQQLKELKAQDPEIKVFINGDAKAYFESAIKVLDEVRRAGITKVAIQTKGLSATK